MKVSGTVEGQPVNYMSAWDSSNPNGGGSFLFRTDFSASNKVGDGPQGVYRSSVFKLAAGDITFDYAGHGGYIALCSGTVCKQKHPSLSSTTMKRGSFTAEELTTWVGRRVFFEVVDDQSGGWGHIAIDNIIFHGDVEAPPPVRETVVDFETGNLASGALKFKKISGTVGGQPVNYTSAADSSNPNGGGSYLFRTDFNTVNKVGDGPQGVYRSSVFTPAVGEITFDYAGHGGYIALCRGADCKKSYPSLNDTTMKRGSFTVEELTTWVGQSVFFEVVDDQSGGWGHIAIDNIIFHGDVEEEAERKLGKTFGESLMVEPKGNVFKTTSMPVTDPTVSMGTCLRPLVVGYLIAGAPLLFQGVWQI